jgi:hypothetical protein
MNIWFRYTEGCLAKINAGWIKMKEEYQGKAHSTVDTLSWMLQVLLRHYLDVAGSYVIIWMLQLLLRYYLDVAGSASSLSGCFRFCYVIIWMLQLLLRYYLDVAGSATSLSSSCKGLGISIGLHGTTRYAKCTINDILLYVYRDMLAPRVLMLRLIRNVDTLLPDNRVP